MSTNINYFQSCSRLTAHFIQQNSNFASILNDMIGAVDQGHVGALMLLDLSAGYDAGSFGYSVFFFSNSRTMAILLTPSTIKSLSRFYQGDSVCRGRPSIGWLTTLVVDVRSSEQVAVIQKTLFSTSMFHKDQSLAQRHFLNTLKTSHISWKDCIITCSLMTCMHGQKHGRPADVSAIISALEDCATDVSAWCAAKRL